MGFVKLKCPSCGADIDLDNSREFGFCTYCGTKVIQDKIVIEHRGSVTIDGMATKKTLMERACVYLKDSDYFNSKIYFNKVLDIDPKCAQAYWGLLLCKFQVSSNKDLISRASRTMNYLNRSKEFINAINNASEPELKRFKEIESTIYKNIKALEAKNLETRINISKLVKLKKYSILFFVASVAMCLLFLVLIVVLANAITSIILLILAIASAILAVYFKKFFAQQIQKRINVLNSKLSNHISFD